METKRHPLSAPSQHPTRISSIEQMRTGDEGELALSFRPMQAVVLLDDEAVGFTQTYLIADYPEHASVVGADEGAAGVDLFIAESELTGRGIGSELLRRFVSEIVFAEPMTLCCIADPEADNLASVRAFEKAGFRVVREFFDPRDGKLHALVRLDRREAQTPSG